MYLYDLIIKNGNQVEFAKKLKVHRSTVNSWVKGRNKPSVKNCIKIKQFFNADLKQLRPDIFE